MLNWIFLLLIVASVVTGALTDHMKEVGDASFAAAKSAVDLAIGLIGQMALWLGFMQVLREAGFMRAIGRALKPILTRLFPDVPPDHPAMGAIIMNLAANMAGVTNAATPFGLKAMQELNKLNKRQGVATNAMALFLAINTAGVAVLPLGAIAVRASLGSKMAGAIFVPSLLATSITTVLGILVAKTMERWPVFSVERADAGEPAPATSSRDVGSREIGGLEQAEEAAAEGGTSDLRRATAAAVIGVALLAALVLHLSGWKIDHLDWSRGGFPVLASIAVEGGPSARVRDVLANWLLPSLMVAVVCFGFSRRVRVYESFVTGAKEGFHIAVRIIPFLVAILVAIGVFRAAGCFDACVSLFGRATSHIGIPAEVLPMAFMKPLSGSGALGIMMETMKKYGPDSLIGYTVSVMQAGSETTFYVLAVYYGSVQIRAIRHTLAACLVADVCGLTGAIYLARLFYPG